MRYRNIAGQEANAWLYETQEEEGLPDWLVPFWRGWEGEYLLLEHGGSPGPEDDPEANLQRIPIGLWIIMNDAGDVGLMSPERFTDLFQLVED